MKTSVLEFLSRELANQTEASLLLWPKRERFLTVYDAEQEE